MLTENGLSVDHSKFFRCLTDLIKGKLKEPRYLDTSFYMPEHFLRLAYSVNENTGLVSLPFDVKDYDKFDPVQAEPERVVPMQGWWSFPKLVPEQMREFIKYVIGGRSVITSSKVADVQLPGLKIKPEIDRKLIQQARQQKKMAAREFLPNEGYYDRMVRLGQDAIDLRELLLLNDNDIKVALRSVRHLSRTGQSVDIGLIARRFDVDEQDLRLLWDWERKNLRYYARDDISQAIHEIASRRKMRVGSEEKMYFLQEAVDILPLVVYSQLIRKDENTALYFTNSKYERTGEIPIACDIKIEFSTKSKTCVFEAAAPVVSLLAGFDVTFFMYFDGVEGLNIIIPYESLPAEGKLASLRHESILIRLAPLLKRSMRMEGATCTLVRDCNAFSIVPYSLHPKTGLACMPLRTSDLRSFYLKDASPAKVEVDNEWWHIPDDAAIAMSGFLNQMALL